MSDAAPQPFEVRAARVLGVGLPLLEVLRRRTDVRDPAAYVDDFVVGALLWFAASAAARGLPHGRRFLAGAWGVLCGVMWSSVFGQLAAEGLRDVSGLPHGVVVAAKLALAATAVTYLVLSVRDAAPRDR